MAHSIKSLVETLNSKAVAAGSDVRAESAHLDCTWGDEYGIRITGTDAARAVAFARAYFAKYLAPRRSYDAQYHFIPRSENEISLVYYPCAD